LLSQLRAGRRVSQFAGLLLGLSLYSYHVRELLVCWLFFCVLFVLLALLVLAGVIACYAGKHATRWARTAAPVSSGLALVSVELHLKAIPDARKLD
jgi:hypothetical protein